MVRLPDGVEPRTAAPFADAGLTAYHVAKRAAGDSRPDGTAVVIGVGGLGHIGIQALRALTPMRIVVVEISDVARKLAEELEVEEIVDGSDDPVARVRDLTDGRGAHAVLDFVAEGDVPGQAMAMLRPGGTYYVVGYGGTLTVPTMEFLTEKRVVGNVGGTAAELMELMALAGHGNIRMETVEYPLDRVNDALADLRDLNIRGRAVVIP